MPEEKIKILFKPAFDQLAKAYSPYSKFKVGASVLADNQKVYAGCNVENASYGATICAERTAITKAVSEGASSIDTILITSSSSELISPCGVCRQFIKEFATDETKIIIATSETNFKIFTMDELLPGAFSKADL